ncbi:MAG: glutathione S-transferase family protein, partial [Marinicaulis sp.]|nr:glutathione S-transferase family protein [Marinicaulis sp.]
MSKLKLYGDPISGNCLKAKWTAEYLGADIEWIPLDILKGETRTKEFLAINPFGQIPALVLSDGRVITQSNAIMVYIVEAYGGALLPEDAYDRARIFQWLFWEQNSHEPYIAGRRFRKAYKKLKDEEIDAEWLPRGYAALELMEGTLAKSDYLVGEAITLADIAVVTYTRVANEGGFDLSDFPAVSAWIARV